MHSSQLQSLAHLFNCRQGLLQQALHKNLQVQSRQLRHCLPGSAVVTYGNMPGSGNGSNAAVPLVI